MLKRLTCYFSCGALTLVSLFYGGDAIWQMRPYLLSLYEWVQLGVFLQQS